MKLLILGASIVTLFLCLAFWIWITTPKSADQIKHEQWQQEQEVIKQDKDRAYNLEQLKLQAEIEKAKPESIKLQEVKNQETTVGEGIQNSVGIAAWAAVGLGLLHIMTR